jgi:RNA-directed DNA polymerase
MRKWRPQTYRAFGQRAGVDKSTLDAAVDASKLIVAKNPHVTPVLSLRHLAHLSGAPYPFLRAVVERERDDPYSTFKIRKRSNVSAFRVICVPSAPLMQVQRWLVDRVLRYGRTHASSTAFAPDSRILDAAEPHVGCLWLIKIDIRSFFESVSEIAVYRVFREHFGFQPLIAFEMARLCTRLGSYTQFRMRTRWLAGSRRYRGIPSYKNDRIGHLPQGAPTSPMLANLCVISLDGAIEVLAEQEGLTYTRYADDLFFSTQDKSFTRASASSFITKMYIELRKHGFSPNSSKTSVSSPGGRKLVLGLLVDGDRPRLSRDFKSALRCHLHYCKLDAAAHAQKRKFAAIAGLRNHLRGLLAYAGQIEPTYASRMQKLFDEIKWPI